MYGVKRLSEQMDMDSVQLVPGVPWDQCHCGWGRAGEKSRSSHGKSARPGRTAKVRFGHLFFHFLVDLVSFACCSRRDRRLGLDCRIPLQHIFRPAFIVEFRRGVVATSAYFTALSLPTYAIFLPIDRHDEQKANGNCEDSVAVSIAVRAPGLGACGVAGPSGLFLSFLYSGTFRLEHTDGAGTREGGLDDQGFARDNFV